MQILKNHGCLKSVAMVTSVLRYTLQRLEKFGDHSLNGFDVIQLFREGYLKSSPV